MFYLKINAETSYGIIPTENEAVKITKCPNCGSTAQPKTLNTEYNEDGWDIEVVRTYICGCGCVFTGTSCYHCQEGYEITEIIPRKIIQEKLYGRG